MSFTKVCTLADVPDEGALRVDVDGVDVAVVRSKGQIYAIDDTCSHAEVSLSEGDVSGGEVECWLHGSRFDLATGRPLCLPATRPIAVYRVTTEGEDVLVDIDQPVNDSELDN